MALFNFQLFTFFCGFVSSFVSFLFVHHIFSLQTTTTSQPHPNHIHKDPLLINASLSVPTIQTSALTDMARPPERTKKHASRSSVPWHTSRPSSSNPNRPPRHSTPSSSKTKPTTHPERTRIKPQNHARPYVPHTQPTPPRHRPPPELTRPHPDRPSRPISNRPSTTYSTSSHHKPPRRHAYSPTSHSHSKPSSNPHSHNPSKLQTPLDPSTASTTTYLRPRGYPRPLPRGNGLPLLSRNHILNTHASITFTPRETQTYHLRTPTTAHKIVPKPSRHNTRTLYTSSTSILRWHTHILSARGAVTVTHPRSEQKLITLQRSSVVNRGRVHGYLAQRRRGGKPDLVIKSERGGYVIRDARGNEVAKISKGDRRKDKGSKSDKGWKVVVVPGFDHVFVGACAAVVVQILAD